MPPSISNSQQNSKLPRAPRMVWVNPRQVCKRGLMGPDGEPMKAGRVAEGTWLWTGDNRLARVGTFGVKVLTGAETNKEITRRLAEKVGAATLDRIRKGPKWRRRLQRNSWWLVPAIIVSPLLVGGLWSAFSLTSGN